MTGVRFNLSTYTNAKDVYQAISSETFDNGAKLVIPNALWLAAIEYGRYWNPSNDKLVWIAYGGKSTGGGNPKWPAKWLHDSGVYVCVMWIGEGDENDAELQNIAIGNWHHCICKFKSFSMYDKATSYAAKMAMRKADGRLNYVNSMLKDMQ